MSTKPKMLMLYAASKTQVYPLAHAMSEYFDVTVSYVYEQNNEVYTCEVSYDIDLPEVNDVCAGDLDIDDYDVFFGFDPTCLHHLTLAKRAGKFCGCTVLDIPYHTFQDTRNFKPSLKEKWDKWSAQFMELDFIVSWREYTKAEFPNIPQLNLFAPTDPPPKIKLPEKIYRQLCYSGRVSPDKGIHNVIEAMSMVPDCPKLLVIGGEGDLEDYAKYLLVPYEHILCSEIEKYEHYLKSAYVISYSDSEWIPPLSPMESISIGKMPIVSDFPEWRRLYGDCATYVEPNNQSALTKTIIRLLEEIPQPHYRAKCLQFWYNNRTNAVYAARTSEFIKSLME